jgi:transcriptional regulator with XRE-family HTH domain
MSESRNQLKEEFHDKEYRYSYAEDFLNTWIATQIITLREQRELSQTQLGELIGTKQPGISRLENVNHSNWKVDTLKRIARALDVRLNISFETFGTLIDQDEQFNRNYLKRPKFEEDPALSAISENVLLSAIADEAVSVPKITDSPAESKNMVDDARSDADSIADDTPIGNVFPFRPRQEDFSLRDYPDAVAVG